MSLHFISLLFVDAFLIVSLPLSNPIVWLAIVITVMEFLFNLFVAVEVSKENNPSVVAHKAMSEFPCFEIDMSDTKVERSMVEINSFLASTFRISENEVLIRNKNEFLVRIGHRNPKISYKLLETIKNYFKAKDVILSKEGSYTLIKIKR